MSAYSSKDDDGVASSVNQDELQLVGACEAQTRPGVFSLREWGLSD
jgi:hypothetical protein